jgi:hypothetical protein
MYFNPKLNNGIRWLKFSVAANKEVPKPIVPLG